MGQIEIHYWAAAKAAAGVAQDVLEVAEAVTLSEVVRRAVDLHQDTRLADVLQVCSALVDDRPVKRLDPETVLVEPGQSVEFLPPFAGG
ncbi:ThiS family protein [Nocardioides terrae]|uniref:ThiS family protein n=1 Tax=Nocardioides terrae TaxID=574651 RepID=A0A1I1ELP2_9ACTN|nr:ThiS family protein [Nocardioides terrae]